MVFNGSVNLYLLLCNILNNPLQYFLENGLGFLTPLLLILEIHRDIA